MKIKIAGRLIGDGEPCFIIAEAGVNHNGSLAIAKKLVDAAANSGADAVKFQTFRAENLVTESAPMAKYQEKNTGSKQKQIQMLKKLELGYGEFRDIKKHCETRGIIFLSTPHTEDAADFLEDIVPAFKIGSGDLTNIPFLEKVSKKGKPIILSTGMGTMEEIRYAVDTISRNNKQIVLLHCTTSYPCPKKDANLNAMKTMEDEFGFPVGYSDHTEGIEIPIMAARLGAVVIEKHLTLDKKMKGSDHKSSLNPEELSEMVSAIRNKKRIGIPEYILGTGIKIPTKQELETKDIVRKSLVAAKYIPENTVITQDMIVIKRPGTGIPPKEFGNILGKKTKIPLRKDELISYEVLE